MLRRMARGETVISSCVVCHGDEAVEDWIGDSRVADGWRRTILQVSRYRRPSRVYWQGGLPGLNQPGRNLLLWRS